MFSVLSVYYINSTLHEEGLARLAELFFFFSFSAHANDYRPRIFSKSFHYQLRQSEKQTLVG